MVEYLAAIHESEDDMVFGFKDGSGHLIAKAAVPRFHHRTTSLLTLASSYRIPVTYVIMLFLS